MRRGKYNDFLDSGARTDVPVQGFAAMMAGDRDMAQGSSRPALAPRSAALHAHPPHSPFIASGPQRRVYRSARSSPAADSEGQGEASALLRLIRAAMQTGEGIKWLFSTLRALGGDSACLAMPPITDLNCPRFGQDLDYRAESFAQRLEGFSAQASLTGRQRCGRTHLRFDRLSSVRGARFDTEGWYAQSRPFSHTHLMASFVSRALAGFLVCSAQISLVASRNLARDSSAGVPLASSTGILVSDAGFTDNEYLVNITLGGKDFTLQLDTGSSDLWVYDPDGSIQTTNDSQLTGHISYVKGEVAGAIQFAELKFGEYTIPSQAFLHVKTLGDGEPPGTVGILGVSFDSNNESLISYAIHKYWGEDVTLGRTVLSNIFAQNTSLQPSYDLALNRYNDLDEPDATGALTIGYHDPQYADITQAPQIPRVVDHQWAGYLDGMKVNGEYIPLPQSAYPNTTDGKLIALFDSGTSDLVIPGALIDAVYAEIEGSIKVNDTWLVPCYNSANLSLTIGGVDYPVHPLDLSRTVQQTSLLQDGTETTFLLCPSPFTDADTLTLNNVDIILGDVFLKNVVTSFNFGSANREGDVPGDSGSFVQLLSLTDPDEAWLDFQLTRSVIMAQFLPAIIDPVFLPQLFPTDFGSVTNYTDTGDITPFPSAASSAPSSSPTTAGVADALEDAVAPAGTDADGGVVSLLDKYGPVVIGLLGANLAVMVLLCVVALAACTRGAMRGGARMRNISPSYAPVSFREKPAAGYDPEEHAPIRSYGEQ